MTPEAQKLFSGFQRAGVRIQKGARVIGLAVRYPHLVRALLSAPPGGRLHRLLREQPEIWMMIGAPFLSANWSAPVRLGRIIDHCRLVECAGPTIDLPLHDPQVLAAVRPAGGSEYALVLHRLRSTVRDGLLNLSLMEGGVRIFSVAFILAECDGELALLVGGLQGGLGADMLDRARSFTRAVHGMRPRDFAIEALRMLALGLGAREILAVSDAVRHQKSDYFALSEEPYDRVSLSYDQAWQERGGELRPDGFFRLSAACIRRSLDLVPSRKRPMYRRRYQLLGELGLEIFRKLTPARVRLRATVAANLPSSPVMAGVPLLGDPRVQKPSYVGGDGRYG